LITARACSVTYIVLIESPIHRLLLSAVDDVKSTGDVDRSHTAAGEAEDDAERKLHNCDWGEESSSFDRMCQCNNVVDASPTDTTSLPKACHIIHKQQFCCLLLSCYEVQVCEAIRDAQRIDLSND
jgi:hypothetical protein